MIFPCKAPLPERFWSDKGTSPDGIHSSKSGYIVGYLPSNTGNEGSSPTMISKGSDVSLSIVNGGSNTEPLGDIDASIRNLQGVVAYLSTLNLQSLIDRADEALSLRDVDSCMKPQDVSTSNKERSDRKVFEASSSCRFTKTTLEHKQKTRGLPCSIYTTGYNVGFSVPVFFQKEIMV